MQPRGRPKHILIADKSRADQWLIASSLDPALSSTTVVSDGDTALQYLFRRGPYHEARRPDLVIIDLDVPGVSGLDLLRLIKSDSETKTIPVIVLSTSVKRVDLDRCYETHANAVIEKPADGGGFRDLIQEIQHFWCIHARLPDIRGVMSL